MNRLFTAPSTFGHSSRALLDLAQQTARRILLDGTENDAPLENIMEADRLRLRPGDAVSVDGIVIEGRSSLDDSLLTGESMPMEMGPSDAVTGATINKNGSLVIEAGKVGADTVLAQIAAMVSNDCRSRAPIQGLADRVSAVFVPTVVAIAIVAFVVWLTVGPEPALVCAIASAVSVPNHRLPLRAWPRHADLDHHGGGARGTGGRADQGCRGAGADGKRRYADRGQVRQLTMGKPKLTDTVALAR